MEPSSEELCGQIVAEIVANVLDQIATHPTLVPEDDAIVEDDPLALGAAASKETKEEEQPAITNQNVTASPIVKRISLLKSPKKSPSKQPGSKQNCRFCEQSFSTEVGLWRHCSVTHMKGLLFEKQSDYFEDGSLKCEKCDQVVEDNEEAVLHHIGITHRMIVDLLRDLSKVTVVSMTRKHQKVAEKKLAEYEITDARDDEPYSPSSQELNDLDSDIDICDDIDEEDIVLERRFPKKTKSPAPNNRRSSTGSLTKRTSLIISSKRTATVPKIVKIDTPPTSSNESYDDDVILLESCQGCGKVADLQGKLCCADCIMRAIGEILGKKAQVVLNRNKVHQYILDRQPFVLIKSNPTIKYLTDLDNSNSEAEPEVNDNQEDDAVTHDEIRDGEDVGGNENAFLDEATGMVIKKTETDEAKETVVMKPPVKVKLKPACKRRPIEQSVQKQSLQHPLDNRCDSNENTLKEIISVNNFVPVPELTKEEADVELSVESQVDNSPDHQQSSPEISPVADVSDPVKPDPISEFRKIEIQEPSSLSIQQKQLEPPLAIPLPEEASLPDLSDDLDNIKPEPFPMPALFPLPTSAPPPPPTPSIESLPKPFKCALCDTTKPLENENKFRLHVSINHIKSDAKNIFSKETQASAKCPKCSKPNPSFETLLIHYFLSSCGKSELDAFYFKKVAEAEEMDNTLNALNDILEIANIPVQEDQITVANPTYVLVTPAAAASTNQRTTNAGGGGGGDDEQKQCNICQFFFPNKSALQMHIVTKHPEAIKGQEQCPICLEFFASKAHLQLHSLNQHPTGQPQQAVSKIKPSAPVSKPCKICNKTFQNLLGHVANHHFREDILSTLPEMPPFKCKNCPNTLPSRMDLFTHTAIWHGLARDLYAKGVVKFYECSMCKVKGVTDSIMHQTLNDLKIHLAVTHLRVSLTNQLEKDKSVPCPISGCDQAFPSFEKVKNHIGLQHPMHNHNDLSQYGKKCRKCFESNFPTILDLLKHTATAHSSLVDSQVQKFQVAKCYEQKTMEFKEQVLVKADPKAVKAAHLDVIEPINKGEAVQISSGNNSKKFDLHVIDTDKQTVTKLVPVSQPPPPQGSGSASNIPVINLGSGSALPSGASLLKPNAAFPVISDVKAEATKSSSSSSGGGGGGSSSLLKSLKSFRKQNLKADTIRTEPDLRPVTRVEMDEFVSKILGKDKCLICQRVYLEYSDNMTRRRIKISKHVAQNHFSDEIKYHVLQRQRKANIKNSNKCPLCSFVGNKYANLSHHITNVHDELVLEPYWELLTFKKTYIGQKFEESKKEPFDETELKAELAKFEDDGDNKLDVDAVLKYFKIPMKMKIIQPTACFNLGDDLEECHECNKVKNGQGVAGSICQFEGFRKVQRIASDFTTLFAFEATGFLDPFVDPSKEDLELWTRSAGGNIDLETAKMVLLRSGDEFCNLAKEELDKIKDYKVRLLNG